MDFGQRHGGAYGEEFDGEHGNGNTGQTEEELDPVNLIYLHVEFCAS